MIQIAAFYLVAALLLFSAVMVVTQRGLFTSALYLAALLSLVGVLFVMLGADFLFAAQILIYVGGILVILAFAVMLSNAEQLKSEPQTNRQWIPSLILCSGVVLLVMAAIRKHPAIGALSPMAPTTRGIGRLLLGGQILPFEAVSLVLLAALVGAVLFSRKDKN